MDGQYLLAGFSRISTLKCASGPPDHCASGPPDHCASGPPDHCASGPPDHPSAFTHPVGALPAPAGPGPRVPNWRLLCFRPTRLLCPGHDGGHTTHLVFGLWQRRHPQRQWEMEGPLHPPEYHCASGPPHHRHRAPAPALGRQLSQAHGPQGYWWRRAFPLGGSPPAGRLKGHCRKGRRPS